MPKAQQILCLHDSQIGSAGPNAAHHAPVIALFLRQIQVAHGAHHVLRGGGFHPAVHRLVVVGAYIGNAVLGVAVGAVIAAVTAVKGKFQHFHAGIAALLQQGSDIFRQESQILGDDARAAQLFLYGSKQRIAGAFAPAAVPGGSVFNGIVSLGRIGVPICFISETGNDHVGNIILNFMRENNIPTDHVNVFPDGKSPVSLAFLNNRSDAEYIFYKDYPKQRLDIEYPQIQEDDIVIIGSYYALNPVLRDKVLELLERAHDMHAIIYYDPNFRSSHKEEAIKLAPTIIENLEYANIVRGSQEDFFYMWDLQEADKIYKDKVKFYCRNFLCTAGAEQVSLRTGTISKEYSIPPLEAVSTIGAGDNFNAGIIFGLLKHNVRYEDLDTMDEATWDQVIQYGIEFAAEVCKSFNNSVSKEFAEARKYQP